MNNQFGGYQNMSPEELSLIELKAILQGVNTLATHDAQKKFIVYINHCHKMLIKKFSEKLPQNRSKDYNLSSAIYEKCLRIKERNQQLKISTLNLRASLSKLMTHTKKSEHERIYTEMIEKIRRKSQEVRNKIEKYRGSNLTVPTIVSSELLRSREVVELKKGTEWLQKKTFELKNQVEVWRQYCSSQSTYRD